MTLGRKFDLLGFKHENLLCPDSRQNIGIAIIGIICWLIFIVVISEYIGDMENMKNLSWYFNL